MTQGNDYEAQLKGTDAYSHQEVSDFYMRDALGADHACELSDEVRVAIQARPVLCPATLGVLRAIATSLSQISISLNRSCDNNHEALIECFDAIDHELGGIRERLNGSPP